MIIKKNYFEHIWELNLSRQTSLNHSSVAVNLYYFPKLDLIIKKIMN